MGLRKAVAGYIDNVTGFLFGRDMDQAPRAERTQLEEAVETARREWQAARNLLDNVTDPRLIDYAIFAAGAAEKRYMYLLDEARRQGLRVEAQQSDDA
ncbi:MAG TPA: YaaL family protein [Limnochordales bacterium]